MFGCQGISVMIKERKRSFFTETGYVSVVCTVCQEYVSRDKYCLATWAVSIVSSLCLYSECVCLLV